jgi:hypothetical protein
VLSGGAVVARHAITNMPVAMIEDASGVVYTETDTARAARSATDP